MQIPFRLYFTDNFSLMCAFLFLVPINSLLFKLKIANLTNMNVYGSDALPFKFNEHM